jgi:hypothetical protein
MDNRLSWGLVSFIAAAAVATVFLFWIPLSSTQRVVTQTILVGALAAALLCMLIRQFWLPPVPDAAEATAGTAWCDRYRPCIAWLLALGGGAVVAFVLVWVLMNFSGGGVQNAAITLPLVVLVGVIVLLIVISLVTFTYSVLGLASPTEALGLPDGSVRAIIALMLLVLFSIVSIYLYNSVATGGALQSVDNVTESQLQTMRTQVSVVLTLTDKATGSSKVYFRDSNPAGEDIAKQLIVLLGTLVTAVASFYFGANAVASANAAVAGSQKTQPPRSTGITPNPIKPTGTPQPLTMTGTSLRNITKLHLEQKGSADIDANNVVATDTTVTAQVTIPSDKTGHWDVVVDDGTAAITISHIEVKED